MSARSHRDPQRIAEDFAFEDEVRRVAEAIWQLDPGDCQPAWYRADPVLHELDGIARLRDITHVLMATRGTSLQKIKSDVLKLNAAQRQEVKRPAAVPVEKWLITEQQLGAEQIEFARKNDVRVMTLVQFRRRFFDARDYVTKRLRGSFGSARNLSDGSISIRDDEYVELPMVERTPPEFEVERPISLDDIVTRLRAGEILVLQGPFGAGKSLTVRQVFRVMATPHTSAQDTDHPVPVAVNLREHWGAMYADEVLERHARSLGVVPRENLTIAWRAGITATLLDGYDEVASQTVARPTDHDFMRSARFEAMRAVRDLVTKTPSGSGLLLAGRDHYFDNRSEMEVSLGLVGRPYSIVGLQEFTEQQAGEYLGRHGRPMILPDWLPRKPLILGYLAHRGLLDSVLSIDATQGFGFVWDEFLDLICTRESEHERSVLEPRTIRRVLERLASIARSTASGDGPVTSLDLAEAYRAETGSVPSEAVVMQLQRLPGLTPRDQDPASRSFVDADLLAALQGSAVARSVLENTAAISERRWLGALGRNGVRMAVHMLRTAEMDAGSVIAVAARLSQLDPGQIGGGQLAADVAAVALELAQDAGRIDGHGLTIRESAFDVLDLQDMIANGVFLQDCLIQKVIVGSALSASGIVIRKCAIGSIEGVASADALPPGRFIGCSIDSFDDTSTNAAVLRLPLAPAMKALLTVLRKLYIQAGGGRKVSALRRGLPTGPVLDAVPEVLRILEGAGMVAVVGEVAHPIRAHGPRARQILAAGDLSEDPVVARVRLL